MSFKIPAIVNQMKLRHVEVNKYYNNLFKGFDDSELFEVYDIEREEFIKFSGRESALVMNKKTLIRGLVVREEERIPISTLIVIKHDEHHSDFTDPIFIGSKDGYRAEE